MSNIDGRHVDLSTEKARQVFEEDLKAVMRMPEYRDDPGTQRRVAEGWKLLHPGQTQTAAISRGGGDGRGAIESTTAAKPPRGNLGMFPAPKGTWR